MQVRKQVPFESTSDLLERILEGGIVVSPINWLELVERGMKERRLVIDFAAVVGLKLAA